MIFSTLVLVKNPIGTVSFAVQPEEWRSLADLKKKKKKKHANYN